MTYSNMRGSAIMFSSAVLFSIMAIMVKALSKTISAPEIIFFRSFISVIMILSVGVIGKINLRAHAKQKLIFRGIVGGISLMLYFYSISLTSLSNAILLSYTYPIFGAFFSALYLNEKLSKENIAFIITAFIGILMIFHFDYRALNLGDVLAILSGITSGMAIVSIRELRKTDSSWVIVLSFVMSGAIFSLFFLKDNFIAPSISELSLLILMGIIGTFGQLFMTFAYKLCTTALGGIISMSSVVITVILGSMIFNEALTINMVIGGILIFTSATFFSLKEQFEIAK